MYLVSIDPGLHGCGVAAWRNTDLVEAMYVSAAAHMQSSDLLAAQVKATAIAVDEWATEHRFVAEPYLYLIERPQTYAGRAVRGDANDLIHVSMVVGAIVALAQPWASSVVTPHGWKGNTPKEVTEAQVKMVLTEDELAHVHLPGRDKKLNGNVWDAIGIGIAHLGRRPLRDMPIDFELPRKRRWATGRTSRRRS